MEFEPHKPEETYSTSLKPKAGWNRYLVIGLLAVILSYGLGYNVGKKGYVFVPKEFKVVNQADQPQTVDYQLLWDALKVINDKYIDKPVDQQQVLYGAVRGAVGATGDPYTEFFEPKDLESFKTDLKGSFDGIGAEIGKRDSNIVIVAPLDGSPAQKAGLLAKDIILKVDNQPTVDWTTDEAVSHIRGQRGTAVTLSIYREGKNEPFDVKIVREKIEIKSVKWQYKDVTKDNVTKKIAVIILTRFGDDTRQLFDRAVNEILTKKVDGLVLDLRNNPGGYLQTSVDVASNWVPSGQVIVTEARSQGDSQEYKASGLNRLGGIKTTVLINGGSASAAEILAGALHDHQLATLIGEKSFGKGSVQELVDLEGGAAVKVTIAKWITPSGKNLNKDGLVPDTEVKMTEEDINTGKDPQMDKALEEITK